LPNLDDIDFLIVLGGPMSVNDNEQFPWLSEEKRYLRKAIFRMKPVLGICLGAQLIASALGAPVKKNTAKEIGWFPVMWTDEMVASSPELLPAMDAFHWHGETFDIPSGAVRIAESEGCGNQGFKLRDSVIGLQFHLESTPDSVEQIVEHCGDELVESTFVQSRRTILDSPPEQYQQANNAMATILRQLTGRH
jgi:GMP synthase-like glutamine amidotransferase